MKKFLYKLLFCYFLVTVPAHGADSLAETAEDNTSMGDQLTSKHKPAVDFDSDFEDEYAEIEVSDPLEKVNRSIFRFNDQLYFHFLKPVARAYQVVPEPARISVANFFSNLFTPTRLVNSLLQLKFKDSGRELGRFLINSSIGVGGLFDPAKKYLGLSKKEEDFGQTLGCYGIREGFYLVLPLIGPSNLRDGIGLIADGALNPIYYFSISDTNKLMLRGYYSINTLSLDKDTYESISRESLDPYLFVRDAYNQQREGLIKK